MEEIQRVTGVLRATAGLIIGGTDSQNPATGYGFEVVTSTKFSSGDVLLSAANQVLRFSGGAAYYIGLQAPTTTVVTSTKTYILPQHGIAPPFADYVLTYQAGDQLTWKSVTSTAGAGDITAVGDVASGDAFTLDGTQGTSLWFYSDTYRGQLTRATLTANRIYTLPNLTGVVALQQAATLTGGGVLFADGTGLIVQDVKFTYSTSTNQLQVGGGGIKLLGGTSGYIGLKASAISDSTTYTWPGTVINGRVLTTNASGDLSWGTIGGAGGIEGGGTVNRVAKFTGTTAIGDSSILDEYSTGIVLTIATTTGHITIANNLIVSGVIYSALYSGTGNVTYTSATTTTIGSGTGDIILDPVSGKITLASGDWIETYLGYQIGKSGIEVLREMIPIFGFEMPTRCGTACQTATTVSRTIEDYPFSPAAAGTDRIHKFVIRYADSTTTASSTWTVFNEDTSTTTIFYVPASASTDLAKGEAYITPSVTIPINTNNWHLRVQVPSGVTIQIYEILLAAYDRIK